MPSIVVNKIRLHYEVYGQGEPLLIMTGLGGEMVLWKEIIQILQLHYYVIIFDHRGSGLSEEPESSWCLDSMVQDTLGLLDYLGISQTHILGHSLGGMVAQKFAYLFPARVKKLILYASSTRVKFLMRQVLRFMIMLKKSKMKQKLTGNSTLLLNMGYKMVSVKKTQSALKKLFVLTQSEPLQGYIHTARIAMKFDSSSWIKKIAAPTLIISCGVDPIFPYAHGQNLKSSIPNSKISFIKEATHCFHLQNPNLFTKHVFDFLTN